MKKIEPVRRPNETHAICYQHEGREEILQYDVELAAFRNCDVVNQHWMENGQPSKISSLN